MSIEPISNSSPPQPPPPVPPQQDASTSDQGSTIQSQAQYQTEPLFELQQQARAGDVNAQNEIARREAAEAQQSQAIKPAGGQGLNITV